MTLRRLLLALLALGVLLTPALPSGGAAPATAASTGTGTDAAASTSAAGKVVTRVVRPVTRAGAPARGWAVERVDSAVACYEASYSAVDAGIASCGSSADSLQGCWRSAGHTVLCVRDPAERTLYRYDLTGAFPRVTARTRPAPTTLGLDDGRDCLLRLGGAWSSPPQRPAWVGYYSCADGAVYGPRTRRDGIVREGRRWSVDTWSGADDGPITRHAVRTAAHLGTARG